MISAILIKAMEVALAETIIMIEVEEQEKTYCPSCPLVAITVLGYCSLQPFQAVKQ